MLHVGMALELARLIVDDRHAEAGHGRRTGSPRKGSRRSAGRHPAADRRFERTVSVAGAAGLLAIALFGPVGLAAAALALAGAVVGATSAGPVRTPHARASARPRVAPTTAPDDRWWAWRAIEPDAAYLRRRAA